jgi:hypothetical protein
MAAGINDDFTWMLGNGEHRVRRVLSLPETSLVSNPPCNGRAIHEKLSVFPWARFSVYHETRRGLRTFYGASFETGLPSMSCIAAAIYSSIIF